MRAEERRQRIITMLCSAEEPLSAGALREQLGVSRQVIVQDIALLRANGHEITATNRGYIIAHTPRATRVFKCRHTFGEVMDEGLLIVNAGGRVEDVFVNHRLYGTLSARLDLQNKLHVEELYRSLLSGASKPLMSVTDGFHYHTVSAESERALDEIERQLREKGFLIES